MLVTLIDYQTISGIKLGTLRGNVNRYRAHHPKAKNQVQKTKFYLKSELDYFYQHQIKNINANSTYEKFCLDSALFFITQNNNAREILQKRFKSLSLLS